MTYNFSEAITKENSFIYLENYELSQNEHFKYLALC